MTEQVEFMKQSLRKIYDIIPQEQRTSYHILMGDRIIGTYTSLKDLQYAEDNEFKYISCLKYIPPSKNDD